MLPGGNDHHTAMLRAVLSYCIGACHRVESRGSTMIADSTVSVPVAPTNSRRILGTRVDATTYGDAAEHIIAWARQRRSCYVVLGAVNNIMEAHDSPAYAQVMEGAALVTSDGMPLVWMLRLLGVRGATRVYGPDLTPVVLQAAGATGLPVGFYGASPDVLARLVALVRSRYPGLTVAYSKSPPFRPLTPDEDERLTEQIRKSGTHILFVGLGSPKQDVWMAEHEGRIPAVMLGVGAASTSSPGPSPRPHCGCAAPVWNGCSASRRSRAGSGGATSGITRGSQCCCCSNS